MNTPKLLPSLMCVDFSRMAQTLEVSNSAASTPCMSISWMENSCRTMRWARISAGSCAS